MTCRSAIPPLAILFLAAPLCLGAALHAVLIGQIRYRYPLDPFLLLLAAPAGWTGLHKILRRAGLGRGRGTDRSEN